MPFACLASRRDYATGAVRIRNCLKLAETAQDWVTAREMADRGDFALARQTLDGVRKRLGFLPLGMEFFQTEVAARQERFAQSFAELAKAVGEHRLEDAMKRADEALAAAPTHRAARQYRDDVWEKLRPETKTFVPPEAVAAVASSAAAWRPTTAPHTTVIPPLATAAIQFNRRAEAVLPVGRWRRRLSRLHRIACDHRSGRGRCRRSTCRSSPISPKFTPR